MPSALIQIKDADDLPKMIGWMIYDFRRDPDGTIVIVLSNIAAPNKVKVSITSNTNFNVENADTIRIERFIHFETEDI